MKRLAVCILLALGLTPGISARDGNAYDRFVRNLEDACVSFSCGYELSGLQGIGTVMGTASVKLQGKSYRFSGGGLVMVSDGESVCVMDESSREAVLENVPQDVSEMDFMMNPALLLYSLKDNFEVRKIENGRYVLSPVVDCGIEKCVLVFTGSSQELSSAEFRLSDGSLLKATVTDYKVENKESATYFKPADPSSFDSSWIVTDLR